MGKKQSASNFWWALGIIAMGAFVALMGLGVVPVDAKNFNGPRWLTTVAGFVFILGGCAVLMKTIGISENTPIYLLPVALLVSGMAAIGLWVAFGPGERGVDVTFGIASFLGGHGAGELIGRAVVGLGALLTTGIAVWIWRDFLKRLKESEDD